MGRDEHDRRAVRQLGQRLGELDAALTARHRDIEEHDVVRHALGQHQRLARTCGLPRDLDAVDAGEQVAQLAAGRRLVIDDQRQQCHAATSTLAGGSIGTRTLIDVPSTGALAMRSRPSSP